MLTMISFKYIKRKYSSHCEYHNENLSAKLKLAPCSEMGIESIEIIILAPLFLNGLWKYWDHNFGASILEWALKVLRS